MLNLHTDERGEYLEDNDAIAEVRVEIVDPGLDSQGIHPVSVALLLSGLCDADSLLQGLHGGVVIEQVGNEGQIQLFVATYYLPRGDKGLAVDLLCLLQHHLSPLTFTEVSIAHSRPVHARRLGGDLIDELGVDFAVLDVLAKVADPTS